MSRNMIINRSGLLSLQNRTKRGGTKFGLDYLESKGRNQISKGQNLGGLGVTLLKEANVDLKDLYQAMTETNPSDKQIKLRKEFIEQITKYCQYVLYTEEAGHLVPRRMMTSAQAAAYANPVPFAGFDSPNRHVAEAIKFLREGSGGGRIGPDDTSVLVPTDGDPTLNMLERANMEVDTGLLQMVKTIPSNMAVEKYDEYGVFINYTRISQDGQIQLGYITDSEFTVPNYEYGAGIGFKWEWFEDNRAGFRINSFAQDFVYYALENKMEIGQTLFVATKVNTFTFVNTVIQTLNDAWAAFIRTADTVDTDKKMFRRNSQFYIYAPLEMAWIFDLAFRAPMDSRSTEQLQFRPVVILTDRIAKGQDFYFGVSNHKREGLQQRTPLTAHGPVENIYTFTTDITYRERYNWFMTAENTVKITLPAFSGIKIYRTGDN